ncbi:MAG: DMT family transporter, partial [Elusimicrobiaceae bacterium]|nr:DMT family transporter [Elusimicrobiaceae bacterium]
MNKLPSLAIWGDTIITAINMVVAAYAVKYASAALFLLFASVGATLCFVPHVTRIKAWCRVFDRKYIWRYLGIGTLGTALPMTVMVFALNYTTPTNASILNQFEIIYSLLLAWILLGEKPSWRQLGGSALIIAGVTMLLWQAGYTPQLKGDLMIIGCLWMFQVSHILAKKLPADLDGQTVACIRSLFAMPALFLLIIYIALSQGLTFAPAPTLWGCVLFSAIFCYFIGNSLWYYGIRNMALGKATAIILSYPVFTFLISVYLGLDKITVFKISGLVLALGGAYIVTLVP